MKLSEYRGEDALDILAEILEPSAKILADEKIWKLWQDGKTIEGIKYAIKNHKKDIIEILAITDGVPVGEYKVNVFTLPMKVMDFVNDEAVKDFFTSQLQSIDGMSFGFATENTEAIEGK